MPVVQFSNSQGSSKKAEALSFYDVLRFAAHYWVKQPIKLATILLLFGISAGLETIYLQHCRRSWGS